MYIVHVYMHIFICIYIETAVVGPGAACQGAAAVGRGGEWGAGINWRGDAHECLTEPQWTMQKHQLKRC